jgi:hypothetical protein
MILNTSERHDRVKARVTFDISSTYFYIILSIKISIPILSIILDINTHQYQNQTCPRSQHQDEENQMTLGVHEEQSLCYELIEIQ